MNNISPIDGRYFKYTKELKDLFTENAFIKQRLMIEISYFIFLLRLHIDTFPYDKDLETYMDFISYNITENNIIDIKKIENEIHHDVKSIEYFLADKLMENSYEKYINLLHFGLTSQDVNTMAYSISIQTFNNKILDNYFNILLNGLKLKIDNWSNIVIVGRTHGQPATWTRLGKEFNVFYTKLLREQMNFKDYKFTTKFGGAVGNMTSHSILSKRDWKDLLDSFVSKYNLIRTPVTTQIHNYDEYSYYFDSLKRVCGILIDMCQDIWLYCSLGELTLNKPSTHVGSSIMPHKVNPIEFENAEGNLKIAEMWLEFMSRELIKSRLQRDLTDSTILRNLGVMFGHLIIGLDNITKGFKYLVEKRDTIEKNLKNNLDSMSEVEQHLLRKQNKVNGYNSIKNNKKFIERDVTYYKNFILNEKKI